MESVWLWLWFCLSSLVGLYASSKGRSWLGYFFLAQLVTPIIGFLVVLILDPIGAKKEAELMATGDMKKCPLCAELVKTEAKICKHCKSDLPETAKVEQKKEGVASDGGGW